MNVQKAMLGDGENVFWKEFPVSHDNAHQPRRRGAARQRRLFPFKVSSCRTGSESFKAADFTSGLLSVHVTPPRRPVGRGDNPRHFCFLMKPPGRNGTAKAGVPRKIVVTIRRLL